MKIINVDPPQPDADLSPDRLNGLGVTWTDWNRQPSLLENGRKFLLLEQGAHSIQDIKGRLLQFCSQNKHAPVIFRTRYSLSEPEEFRIRLAGELGFLLVDGALDAVWVENKSMNHQDINEAVEYVLQAAGARITRAEYIACPSCGRTHFDILARLEEIRAATSHLNGVKIAVMGCIVNGPGEMAGADYGFVGAGRGRISLYKGKIAVRKNIPEEEAVEALIVLMKREGDWNEPLTNGRKGSPGEKRSHTRRND